MRNFVDQQLGIFLQSILLGLAIGVAHDLLRPFRLRLPRFAWVLDAVYCLWAAAALFLFALNRTQGQLRIFALVGTLGGTVLFFTLFSALLRPIWDFWADTLDFLLHLLQIPWIWLKNFSKKMSLRLKNIFLFMKKCYTIEKIACRRYKIGRGGSSRGKDRRAQKKPSAAQAGSVRKAAAGVAHRRAGVTAIPTADAGGAGGNPEGFAERAGSQQPAGQRSSAKSHRRRRHSGSDGANRPG